ncbi:MAG: NlpC/P60 family protein [Actinomycetota bacterium]
MQARRRGVRARQATRWAVALLLLAGALTPAIPSAAAPSAAQVAEAKRKLEELNRQLELYVEQYNQARLALEKVQDRLAETRDARDQAIVDQSAAEKALNRNAARAYQSVGSQLLSLFDATSLNDFSDRLEFIGNIAQADLDLATRAARARERANWTAAQLRDAITERKKVLDDIAAKKKEILDGVAKARALYTTLNRDFQDAIRSSAAYAGEPPRVSDDRIQRVLDAAFSMRGVRYVFGAANPSYGFDCSGLMLWAYAQIGIYLPHSSQAQYATLPHVDRADLKPGDLLFFYSPISHVGMYLTRTTMIDANHPGDVVNVRPIHWEYFVGAARP